MKSLVLGDRRILTILALHEDIPEAVSSRFVALVPAYTDEHCAQVIGKMLEIVQRECCEICAVGPLADVLHNRIDDFLVGLERDGIEITDGIVDEAEACDYFVNMMDAREARDLVAFVSECAAVKVALRRIIDADACM